MVTIAVSAGGPEAAARWPKQPLPERESKDDQTAETADVVAVPRADSGLSRTSPMRQVFTLAAMLLAVGSSAWGGDAASMVVTVTVEPYAAVEQVTPPTMPAITQPNQTVEGSASFQVTTNHDVVAYLGTATDTLTGPGGQFRYQDPRSPLQWSANFPGRAVGQGLPLRAGAHQLCQVEVRAATGQDWNQVHAGRYTGRLSLTLLDR